LLIGSAFSLFDMRMHLRRADADTCRICRVASRVKMCAFTCCVYRSPAHPQWFLMTQRNICANVKRPVICSTRQADHANLVSLFSNSSMYFLWLWYHDNKISRYRVSCDILKVNIAVYRFNVEGHAYPHKPIASICT